MIDKIKADLKEAMMARNETKVSTLRMVIAAVSNARIAKGSDLTDEEVIKIIQKEVKQIQEAVEGATQAGREDLIQKNEAEKKVLSVYLPEKLDDSKVEEMVVATIHEIGAAGPGDIGRVMASVMPKLRGQADGAVVSRLVSQHLGS